METRLPPFKQIKEEITMEIRKCLQMNEKKTQNVLDTAKAALRRNFIGINVYV